MEPSGKAVRSLREALHMSQAEFAKASGWSVSTISSWERGRATPSRLAFKTILAFAEAHGVRFQAPGETPPSGQHSTLPVLRMPSRLAAATVEPTVEVVDVSEPTPPARAESFGSRRWTAVAGDGLAALSESRLALTVERARWKTEADFRRSVGTRPARRRSGYVAAAAALMIGVGVGTVWQTRTDVDPGRHVDRGPAVAAPAPVAAIAPADLAPDIATEEIVEPWHETPEFPATAPPAEPAPRDVTLAPTEALARLESIVALDGIRRASFRVGDRSVTLVEGDQLGARAIALIEDDEVTLVGAGEATRVRLGFETGIE